MAELICHAKLTLPHHGDYMGDITDRLASFQAQRMPAAPGVTRLRYAFGWAEIVAEGAQVRLRGGAPDPNGLARLKDLMATAFMLYAKADAPRILWQGDAAGDRRLDSFRLMRVLSASSLTPHMRRIRLGGEGLDRFAAFGNMHVRLLLPSPAIPAPVWPTGPIRSANLSRGSIRSGAWMPRRDGSISTCCCMTGTGRARHGRERHRPVTPSA